MIYVWKTSITKFIPVHIASIPKKLKSLTKQIYEKGCIEKFNKESDLIIIYFTSGFKIKPKNNLLRNKNCILIFNKIKQTLFSEVQV